MIEPRGFSLLIAEGAAMKRLLVYLLLLGVLGCGESKEEKAVKADAAKATCRSQPVLHVPACILV